MLLKKTALVRTCAVLFATALLTVSCSRAPSEPNFLSDKPSAGALKTLVAMPKGNEIPIATEGVTLMFDRAMVPLTTLDKGRDLAVPLTIAPPTPGKFYWLGTKGFIFRPESPFVPSTNYTVTLPTNLSSLDGHKLESQLTWTFATVSPQVRSFEPSSASTLLPKRASVRINFNVAMNRDEVAKQITITQKSSGTAITIPYNLIWLNGDHTLLVKFVAELPWDEELHVALPAGIHGAKGDVAMKEPAEAVFTTPASEVVLEKVYWTQYDNESGQDKEIELAADGVNELPQGRGVCFRFSQPITTDSFTKTFHAEPDADPRKKNDPFFYYREYETFYTGEIDQDGYETYLEGDKTGCVAFLDDYDRNYRFNFSTAPVETLSGAKLADETRSYAIHTGDGFPDLDARLTKTILTPTGDMKIPYRALNLAAASFKIYRFDKASDYSEQIKNARLSGRSAHYDQALQLTVDDEPPTSKIGYSGPLVPVDGSAMTIDNERLAPIHTEKVTIGDEKNISKKFFLDLASLEGGFKLAPGIYLVEAVGAPLNESDNAPANVYSMVQVSSVALAIKREVDHVLVWATDTDSGTPLAGVPLHVSYSEENGTWREADGITDTNGVALMDGPWSSEDYAYGADVCATVTDPARFATSCQEMHAVDDSYKSVLRPGSHYFSYVYTDRPIYRPGQTVHYSSFVREVREGRYMLSDNDLDCDVSVTDASGEQIYNSEDVNPEAGGVVKGEFILADGDDTPRGQYSIQLSVGSQTFSRSFFVQSYRKPSFKVDAKTATPEIVNGDTLAVDVTGAYFFGAPMRKAKASWAIMTSTYFFSPEGFGDYTFVDDDLLHSKEGEDSYYSDYEYDTVASWPSAEDDSVGDDPRGSGATRSGGPIFRDADDAKASGLKGQLDDAGKLAISYKPDLKNYPVSQVLTVEANVQDPGLQEVSTADDVVVHKAQFYLGLKPQKWAYAEKDTAVFDVVSLDTSGKPVSGKEFTADFIRRDYNFTERRNAQGYWEFDYESEDIPVTTVKGVTDAQGKTAVTVAIPQGGTYRLVLKSKDARGNAVQAAATTQAWGKGYVPWKIGESQKLELVPDKDSYKVGETAHILVKSMLPVTKALLSFERGRILDYKIADLGGNATHIDVPITEGMLPNVYVDVLAHVGKSADHPQLVYSGETELRVDPESKRLKIAITTDRAGEGNDPPVYGPGDEVTVTLAAQDSQGNPVKSHIIVSVADESVLRLLDYQLPDLVEKFYYERTNGVKTSSSLVSLKAGDGAADKKKRRVFQDTADFQAHVTTDASGRAQFKFKLPDDLTTWVIEALAVSDSKSVSTFKTEADANPLSGTSPLSRGLALSDGTFVGGERAKIMTTIPVVTRAALPRFVAWGDKVSGKVVLTNRNATPVAGTMTLSLSGGAIFAGGQTEEKLDFALAAKEEKTLPAVFSVNDGTQKITFAATSSDKSGAPIDAFEITLKALDRYAPEAVALSGTLSEATEDKEVLDLPKDVVADKGGLTTSFKSSLGLAVAEPMRHLIYFPWGCSEQKSSHLAAVVMARDFADRFGEKYLDALAPFTNEEKLALKTFAEKKKFLSDRAQRLIDELLSKFQHENGGIKYWPDNYFPDWFASAQVAWILSEAKVRGYAVDATRYANLVDYLFHALNNDKWGSLDDRAYVLSALAATGTWQPQLAGEVRAGIDKLNADGAAFALIALARYAGSGIQDDGITALVNDKARFIDRLLSFSKQEPRHTSWAAAGSFATSAIKTTSLAATALLKADPANPVPARTMNFLFNRKKAGGAFSSTQDDLYLSWFAFEFSRAAREDQTDFTAKLSVAGAMLAEKKFDKSNLLEEFGATTAMKDLPVGSASDMVFAKNGSGTLYYDALLKYYLPPDETPPREEGLMVSREYFGLDDVKETAALKTFKAGETYKGRITITVPQDMNYVLLVDELPAGFEPVDLSLATTSRAAQTQAGENDDASGSDDGFSPSYDDEVGASDYGTDYAFGHQEIRDDAIVWSDHYLPAGVYRIRYPVRASVAGHYLLPGAYASEFYEPEIFGRSRPGEIDVVGE